MAGWEKFGVPGPGWYRWVPHHAREDPLRFIAEVRTRESHGAAPRAGKKQHLSHGQQSGMHGKDAGFERQHVPSSFASRIGIQIEHLVQAGILLWRVVDVQHDTLSKSTEVGHRKTSALVFPREPTRDTHPWSPAGDGAGDLQLRGALDERLVLSRRVVNLENDKIVIAGLVSIDHRYTGTLVFPREPARHQLPTGPADGDTTVGIESVPNAIVGLVLLLSIVDHEDDQFGAAIAVQIIDRNGTMLVLPREPIGELIQSLQPPVTLPLPSNDRPTR